jgi:hypothetical protein
MFPHLFCWILYSRIIIKKLRDMIKTLEQIIYESPQLDSIEVEVEQGFAISNLENPKEGEESEW